MHKAANRRALLGRLLCSGGVPGDAGDGGRGRQPWFGGEVATRAHHPVPAVAASPPPPRWNQPRLLADETLQNPMDGSPPVSPVKLPCEANSLIVLDWDDTLLPTTQLTDNYGDYITGGATLPPRIVAELATLQDVVVRFLDQVVLCGSTTVITNAMNGWVTLSGRLFVPRVLEALERHGIEVMYAREKHGNTGDAEEWKMTAFASLVRRPAVCAASGRPAPRCSVL
eukprot:COSAG04_NODE_959_length_9164_cov_3.981798_5_plen_227_part_00